MAQVGEEGKRESFSPDLNSLEFIPTLERFWRPSKMRGLNRRARLPISANPA
jgi:hypothetical protein